ncbi:cytochrome C6 [Synechococcus sp. BSF8S]|uniref:c-type cytochrome n=1 Tax=Synechococcales TaxID=1890424 RepID=UPI00162A698A|nr:MULTISPECIES: c-type cytochrome [unclassified Synechococcus]MBC1260893.1 cytochrome C6 [Synechococcus sp. BSF8S]MBC1263569.1 cytochrome C6 [Synechococcus sp. BSA11S]
MSAIPTSAWSVKAWRRLLGFLALLALVLLIWWPRPVWGESLATASGPSGESLFANHCAGCHVNGGNILRRSKTLRLRALERNGITGPEAIATIAAGGLGQMSGYGEALGLGGPEAVADWVWQQAQQNWVGTAEPAT